MERNSTIPRWIVCRKCGRVAHTEKEACALIDIFDFIGYTRENGEPYYAGYSVEGCYLCGDCRSALTQWLNGLTVDEF